MNQPGYLRPALLGGLLTGVLSALPIVSAGNLCCCLWVVSGGLLSAYILQQERPDPITAADGAMVGLLAGVVGAVVQFVLSIPIGLLLGPVERRMMERLRDLSGNAGVMPFGLDRPGVIGVIVVSVIAFVFALFVGSAVSAIAGLVGAALFAKKEAPRPAAEGQSWGGPGPS